MNFHQLIQYKALDHLHTLSGSSIIDRLPESEIPKSQMRNVCALISVPLFEELEAMCGLLGLSKREFIEAALIESLAKANTVIDEVGLHQALWEQAHGAPYPGHEVAAQIHRDAQEARE